MCLVCSRRPYSYSSAVCFELFECAAGVCRGVSECALPTALCLVCNRLDLVEGGRVRACAWLGGGWGIRYATTAPRGWGVTAVGENLDLRREQFGRDATAHVHLLGEASLGAPGPCMTLHASMHAPKLAAMFLLAAGGDSGGG